MRTNNLLLLLGILSLGTIRAHAQAPCDTLPLPKERVALHLDRNVCLAGETLWFKAWCFLEGKLEREISKVLYVEIFDETGKAIIQEKYRLNNNTAAGAIPIPEDVPGKYYFLRAYTRYMRNFSPAGFHYQQLVIANPYIEHGKIQAPAGATLGSAAGPPSRPPRPAAAHPLRIAMEEKQYQPREEIKFEVRSPEPLSATLSATVRLQGLSAPPHPEVLHLNPWLAASCREDPFCRLPGDAKRLSPVLPEGPGVENKQAGSLTWLPETRGLTVSGFIRNERGENLADAPLLVAVVQESPMLHIGATDEKGAFTVALQNMQYQKGLLVGTPNKKGEVFIQNDFDPRLPDISPAPLMFDSSLHRLLEALYLHQQVTQVYPVPENQPAFQPRPFTLPPTNLLAPDRRFVLADYIEVPTLSEVFNEITAGVALRKEEGRPELAVFNPAEQEWVEAPLVLLDNVPVFDTKALLDIDPAEVQAIEVFESDYILGDYTVEAAVSVKTQTKDFAGYQWGGQAAFTTFKGFAAPRAFAQVVDQGKRHHPDFRPVLYWQPGLRLRPGQASEAIAVLAPDRPGVYEVVVRGFTRSGASCFGYTTFEVVPAR
mgnify:CR=1 FL=1